MVDMILALKCSDIRASKRTAALVAEETKPAEVIRLAERILTTTILVFGGKEFGRDNLTTVLRHMG